MYSQVRKALGILCCLALLPALSGCGEAAGGENEEAVLTEDGLYFDTAISITVAAESQEEGQAVLDGCMELCQEIENTFSRTSPDSELYRVNHRETDTVKISDELAEVIAFGLEFYEISGGRLDITIAPVLELWNFTDGTAELPDETALQEAVSRVDASSVHLDGNTLTFDREDTELDLGALAKGYAADRLKAWLEEQGIGSALINLGGNVHTVGSRPDGSPWRVGIQVPFADRGVTDRVIEVSGQSVVSSGIYERYFELDGIIYHHVLDPDTGYPVENGLAQVTVVSDNSLLGDALSTTCLLLGREQAEELLQSFPEAEVFFEEMQDLSDTESL